MVATSKNARTSGAAHLQTAAAKSLVPPKKTGNLQKDEEASGKFRLVQSIVDDLFSDPNHVVPTYNFVQ